VVIITAKEAEKIIKNDGWTYYDSSGSHFHYKHSTKTGKVTIPFHAGRDLRKETVNSIMKQAGLKRK
jgi:predicted RNA binding protein YcfA (HicA-like mRNA interferase family)